MSIELARNAVLWCAIINYALLVVWFLLYTLAHEWLYRLWGTWFRLRTEQFDMISLAGIMLYQIGIILFNLVPYVALSIVR
jgi:hypothetical protein